MLLRCMQKPAFHGRIWYCIMQLVQKLNINGFVMEPTNIFIMLESFRKTMEKASPLQIMSTKKKIVYALQSAHSIGAALSIRKATSSVVVLLVMKHKSFLLNSNGYYTHKAGQTEQFVEYWTVHSNCKLEVFCILKLMRLLTWVQSHKFVPKPVEWKYEINLSRPTRKWIIRVWRKRYVYPLAIV